MGQLMQHLAATEAAERDGREPPTMRQNSRKSGYGQGREQPPIRSGAVLTEQVSNEGVTGYLLPQPVVRDLKGAEVRFDEFIGAHFAIISHGVAHFEESNLELIDALQIKVIDISVLQLARGKFPRLAAGRWCLLLRPDRLVFGHTDASISLDSLLERFAEAIKFSKSA